MKPSSATTSLGPAKALVLFLTNNGASLKEVEAALVDFLGVEELSQVDKLGLERLYWELRFNNTLSSLLQKALVADTNALKELTVKIGELL